MEEEFVPVYMTREEANAFMYITKFAGPNKTQQSLNETQRQIDAYRVHIEKCFILADSKKSKLHQDVFNIYGHSGVKTRCFYNNMGELPAMRYLEIGVLHGSSTCSMLFNNRIDCVSIDNFSEFEGTGNEFHNNLEKYRGENNVRFINQDCWSIDPSSLGKFNVYLYDGPHEETDHYKALHHYKSCLDDVFIYIIDDWNWPQVREGTLKAIKDNNLKGGFKKELKTTTDDTQPYWDDNAWPCAGPKSDWHNGICIFVLVKGDIDQQ